MTRAAIVGAMMAALTIVSAASAQTARIDPVETPRMFREAVLGYCAERVQGEALVAHAVDPAGGGWVDLENPQVSGGQRIFSGRLNSATGVIVDVSPGGGSCFVQVNLDKSTLALTEQLRSEIRQRPHSMLLDERTTAEGHSTVFGLVDPAVDQVRIFSFNDSGAQGTVSTAIVALGSQGTE